MLLLPVTALLGGCAIARYHQNEPPGKTTDDTYPIPIYTEDVDVPRPCQVIGTVSVHPGSMAMFGGTSEKEMAKIMKFAHGKGADAVKITHVEKPGFANPNYRIDAALLRYLDVWESVSLSPEDAKRYFKTNAAHLDPIEGIWYTGGLSPYIVGIMKNHRKSGRDFIGFVLTARNPVWISGMKKMDIERGMEPGTYVLTYYFDDFARREAPIRVVHGDTFSVNFQKDDEDHFIIYTKN